MQLKLNKVPSLQNKKCENMNKIFIGLVSMALLSCTSSKKTTMNQSALYQKWDLTTLNGDSINPGSHKDVYIQFSDSANRAFGSGPCNRFFSQFALSGNKLNLSAIGSTKMACLDEKSNHLEQSFFSTLESADSYKVSGENLQLISNGKIVATFEKHQSIPDELVGNWELFYITGPRITFEGLYPDRKPTLNFKAGETELSGFTSCNGMSAKFLGKKGSPLFKPGIMTMKACPGNGEQTFLNALHKVDDYKVEGDTLTFLFNKIPFMQFKKQ